MNIISNKLLYFHQHNGMSGANSLISLTRLLEADSTDFVALERTQRQVYIEVEGGAPGDPLTGFTQDYREQQTALNSTVPQVRGKGSGRKIQTQLEVCIGVSSWKRCSTGAANWIDKEDGD